MLTQYCGQRGGAWRFRPEFRAGKAAVNPSAARDSEIQDGGGGPGADAEPDAAILQELSGSRESSSPSPLPVSYKVVPPTACQGEPAL